MNKDEKRLLNDALAIGRASSELLDDAVALIQIYETALRRITSVPAEAAMLADQALTDALERRASAEARAVRERRAEERSGRR